MGYIRCGANSANPDKYGSNDTAYSGHAIRPPNKHTHKAIACPEKKVSQEQVER